MQGSRRIAHPAGIETHVDDHLLDRIGKCQIPPDLVVNPSTY